jgi:hypothetical protein
MAVVAFTPFKLAEKSCGTAIWLAMRTEEIDP